MQSATKPNKTDVGNGSKAVCRVIDASRSPSPDPRREAQLDELERSGMKGLPFAQMAGIDCQTFASWIQKRRLASGDDAKLAQKPASKSGTAPRKAALQLGSPRWRGHALRNLV